jgi:NAD(P)-dependent dehydrogenase (short-subunit alcohol dehydrogenase family)
MTAMTIGVNMSRLLEGKNAIIYGGGGGIGGGVARTFARGEDAPTTQTVVEMISGMAALRRTPRLADVAEVAAFLASDRAAGVTGTMTNVTAGLVLR